MLKILNNGKELCEYNPIKFCYIDYKGRINRKTKKNYTFCNKTVITENLLKILKC